MRSMKLFGLAVVAVCALGLAMTTSAFATLTNPEFLELSGTTELPLLVPLGVSGQATSTQYLTSTLSGNLIECSSLQVLNGHLLVNILWGAIHLLLRYTNCSRTGKTLSECYVQGKGEPMGTITTTPLLGALGYRTENGAKTNNINEGTVTAFKPASGTVFSTIELKGGSCGLSEGEHKVEGEQVLLNLPPATHALSHELEGPSTRIKSYYTDSGTKATEHEVGEFVVTGLLNTGGSYVGTSSVTSENGTTEWGVGL